MLGRISTRTSQTRASMLGRISTRASHTDVSMHGHISTCTSQTSAYAFYVCTNETTACTYVLHVAVAPVSVHSSTRTSHNQASGLVFSAPIRPVLAHISTCTSVSVYLV